MSSTKPKPTISERIFSPEVIHDPEFIRKLEKYIEHDIRRRVIYFQNPDSPQNYQTFDIIFPDYLKYSPLFISFFRHSKCITDLVFFNRTHFILIPHLSQLILTLAPLRLPSYIILEIINNLPQMRRLKESDKIYLITNIMKSYRKLRPNPNPKQQYYIHF
jgi:hypothetical protein